VHAKLGFERSKQRLLRPATARFDIRAQLVSSIVNLAAAKLTACIA
jgi:hypothetical protein